MMDPVTTAQVGLNDSFSRLNEAAAQMTPNNPDGYEKPLLAVNQAETQAQANLKVIKSWNENIGRLLDILA